MRDLVVRADVLVENFRVGTMERWGLDYISLHEINHNLIYCSISGYGQTGPLAARPGYDNIIEAQGGIMSITGPAGDDDSAEPYKVGVAIVDITTGLYAAMSILAALNYRSVAGTGQHIDLALFDTQLGWLANVGTAYLVSGEPPKRYGNGHSSIVPYQTFHASDRPIMVAAANDAQFSKLATVCGHPEWMEDSRFRTNKARVDNRHILVPLLADLFTSRTATAWATDLQEAGIPCSPVNDIPTALSEPQAQHRNMVQTVEHPKTGTIPQLGPVPKLSQTPPMIGLPPPLLGEHTDTVLSDFLGLSQKEIAELVRDGIV